MATLVVLCGLLLLGGGCGRAPKPQGSPSPASPSGTPSKASAATPNASGTPEYLPAERPHDGYVGSASCRECHAEEHASWHKSHHRTMTQLPSRASIQARFAGQSLTNDGTRFTLLNDGDRFGVRVESITPPSPGEPGQPPVQIVLGLVTGSHHMQVFWLPNGAGNCQVGFPFTWLIPEQRWVPRTMTFLRPPDATHRPEVWNALCIRCHATGMEPHFRPSQGQVDTRVAEFGISCEACHGPAERHVALARSRAATPKASWPKGTDWQVVNPRELPPERGSQVCGSCHSMKWLNPEEHWFDKGFSYRPGDDLEKTTPLIRHATNGAPAALLEYLRGNPEILQDFFWADGMIRVSGREYNGLVESPCHKGGKFTCISCHSMHQGAPDDQLDPRRTGAQACTQCHPRLSEPTALVQHTHHAANSTGSECYNCHMPHTTYGVLSAIRSHTVSSPRVADQLATGRPNACNLCHLDQTLDWTARHLADWYRQPRPTMETGTAEVAEGMRLALSGDAGQRVLIAWHLGWPVAQAVSGKDWQLPVLGELLEDPYAAVRCVGERSLKTLRPGGIPGYDFTEDPPRPGSATVPLAAATTGPAPEAPAGPLRGSRRVGADPIQRSALLEAWKARRIERPIRLRE